jgi:hypothetical protein
MLLQVMDGGSGDALGITIIREGTSGGGFFLVWQVQSLLLVLRENVLPSFFRYSSRPLVTSRLHVNFRPTATASTQAQL